MSSASRAEEAGFATLILPVLVWVATLAAIASIDVAAYLVAAARAQTLADSAALAAVGGDEIPQDERLRGAALVGRGDPRERAAAVVRAGGGRLERCDCLAGRGQASTEVSMPVGGLVLPNLGARRVAATADAVLVPTEPAAAGRRGAALAPGAG